jgi:uncharacterized protein YjbJ (UPF0337 family)
MGAQNPLSNYARVGLRTIALALQRCLSTKEQERYMNKDQIKGRVDEVKGKVKEVAGKAIGNKRVEAEGDVEQVAGKVQKAYGDAKNEARKSR